MSAAEGKENLKREIGVRSLTLAILNATVGTGIFVIPAIVAQSLGATAILAYFICGGLIFLIALCFAEVGSKTSASGGIYTYIENAFGPFAGFLANNIYWFGASVISDAALANALADTLKYFFPAIGVPLYRILFFVFIFCGLALLNIRSVKNGVRFIEFAAFGKLLPMVVLVVVGATFISSKNLEWTTSLTIENITSASLLLFYAFMGMETPLSNGGEIKNPKRTVPISIFSGILIVLILYVSIQLVTQGVLGKTIAEHSDAPLAAVAGIIFGPVGMILIIITTAISMLGALGGELLSIPRILFAGARDGLMPQVLAKVHPRFATPHIAIAVYALLGMAFAISGGFRQLAVIASASSLLVYLGMVLATLQLRKKDKNSDEKTFRVPGGIIIPLMAIAVICWLLFGLGKNELTSFFIFIATLSLIYFVNKKMIRRVGIQK